MSKVAYGRKPLGWFVRRNDNNIRTCNEPSAALHGYTVL